MNNNWKRIRRAYKDYQSLYTRKYVGIPIIYYHTVCFTCIKEDKIRFKIYKNFLIYLANHWGLLNITNNINEDFKKLKVKISTYRNNIIKIL